MVPVLMRDLFDWLKNDKETPLLIKSCIFHYEFIFIHPFGDGNGRTARFWQNLLFFTSLYIKKTALLSDLILNIFYSGNSISVIW